MDTPLGHGISSTLLPHFKQQVRGRFYEKIASDPGHALIGRLEKADPITGEPASQYYYWIIPGDGSANLYFDGNSVTGQKILKVCKVGRLCAMKVAVEKSWEHNMDHATFWISKIVGEPIGE